MVLASGQNQRMAMEVTMTDVFPLKTAATVKFDIEMMYSIIRKVLDVLSSMEIMQSSPQDHFAVTLVSSML
jgi:hypothetical protein